MRARRGGHIRRRQRAFFRAEHEKRRGENSQSRPDEESAIIAAMKNAFPFAPPSGFLMDLDGTLADTAPGIHAAGARALADLGLPSVSLARARGFIGDGMPRFVKRLLTGERWENPDPELFERAFALMRSHYARECAVASDLYPGVRVALERLSAAKIPMACVTNKPAEFTGPVLKACGLDDVFASVVCGDSPEWKKPRPDGLLRACRELGLPPGEAVMVGDSADTDLRAAAAAGCGFIGVSYGYGVAPFPPGTMVVDSLEELVLKTRTAFSVSQQKKEESANVAAA